MVHITQELEKTGDKDYKVTLYIDNNGGEVKEKSYTFNNTNDIYPLYKSLIFVLRDYQDEYLELKTVSQQLVKELKGNPNKQDKLLRMLLAEKAKYNITFTVLDD